MSSEFFMDLEKALDDVVPEGDFIFGDQAEQFFQSVKGEELFAEE